MVNLLSICSDYALAYYLYIVKKIIGMIQLAVPIIAVVMLVIRFTTAMIKVDDKSNNKKIFTTVFALVIVFFLPVVVNLLMSVFSDTGNSNISSISACWVEAENIYKPKTTTTTTTSSSSSSTEKVKRAKTKAVKTIKKNSTSTDKNTSNNKKSSDSTKKKNDTSSKEESSNTVVNGKKYKLTDAEIKYLAAVCMREQGSPDGMRGEAHLIANRYELYGKSKYRNPADYVKRGGWFGSSRVSPTNNKTAISIVKSVFVQGNRTVPLYIDEHDCWFCNKRKRCSNGNMGDICSITGGTSKAYITNRKNYKQGKTIIKNPYGSTYTFYYFPASTSDPFGYTDQAYKAVKKMNK